MKKTNQKTNIFLVNKKLGKQENLVEEKNPGRLQKNKIIVLICARRQSG